MEKQPRFRELKGPPGVISRALLMGITISGALYILDIPQYFGKVFFRQQYLGLFLFFLLPAIFLLRPATNKASRDKLPWYDMVFALLGVVIGGYVLIFYPKILSYIGFISTDRIILGTIAVVLVLEGTRRMVGWPLVIIALIFIFYARFSYIFPGILWGRGFSWERISIYLYLQPDSLLGVALYIAASIVLAFILFGQTLFSTGGGQFITEVSTAIMGKFRGGAAKVAVLGSGLFGTMSGSAVSDVATTGVITIPMMKRIGYRPHVAAAIEAVASSGGGIMPPIMGAAAFVMSEFLEVPYTEIVIAAVIPAVFYYLIVFLQVDLQAAKIGLKGLQSHELPSLKRAINKGWFFIIPGVVLIYCLFLLHLRPAISGVYSAGTVVLISMFKKETRLGWKGFLAILEGTGRTLLDIGIICCTAGFIIGMVALTGLGFVFSKLLISIAGGSLFVLLVLTAIGSIILGMGMPITASYIILVILTAPALVELGVEPMAAHLFIIYFGILSFITPPVCLAVYTASGIARSEPMRTGFEGMRLGIVAYVVPFIFVFNPNLLLMGTVKDIILSVASTLSGALLLAIALQGYLFQKLNLIKRVCFILAAVGLFIPHLLTDFLGWGLAIALFFWEWRAKKAINSD
jgi:TRAP transporter 4TM/12TM fusion protein